MRLFKTILSGLLGIIFLLTFLAFPYADGTPKNSVISVRVENTVTAGTAKHIKRALQLAAEKEASAVVIMLNTPGGLVSSTLDIIQAMSASNIPIITYVSPQGAIAASAGTFILLNGHIAAMSPGTTCGAAMPVTMAEPVGTPQAADQKTINFLAGHMRSIAEERSRPGDLAERFVKENLTLNNKEALEMKVIDLVAEDIKDLLTRIDGTEIKHPSGLITLHTANAEINEVTMDSSESIIGIIGNPMVAIILLLLGFYGLIIGFSTPGFLIPEVLGSISLILGLFGLGLFETNITAGLLIILGIGLLIAELFTATYGILAVGGLASLVLGIVLLPVEPLMPNTWFRDFKVLALGLAGVSAVFILIVVAGIWRLRSLGRSFEDEFSDQLGLVIQDLKPQGQIRVRGEIWSARLIDSGEVKRGEKVRVVNREGLLLLVKPLNGFDKEKGKED
ncbi:MAG: NfeD family protein [Syntrophomonadaceae bacterium]|jgi:membrane-bound serine protease (ClpP class)